jgi:hypothetical protein
LPGHKIEKPLRFLFSFIPPEAGTPKS